MEQPRDPNINDADFRRRVALRALYLLREAIERNGERYSGMLVPNITSIAHILTTADMSELRRLIKEFPSLNPDVELSGFPLPRLGFEN